MQSKVFCWLIWAGWQLDPVEANSLQLALGLEELLFSHKIISQIWLKFTIVFLATELAQKKPLQIYSVFQPGLSALCYFHSSGGYFGSWPVQSPG